MDGQFMSIHIDTLCTRATINTFMAFTNIVHNDTVCSSLRLEKGFHLHRIKVQETLIDMHDELGT